MALSSLHAQTFSDWEAVVVDDGSTDGTAKVVDALTDERIAYVRQPQAGAAAARNRGMSLAKGEFLAFLDADDFVFPQYLERSLDMLRSGDPKSIVTHNAYYLYPGGIEVTMLRHSRRLPKSLRAQRDELLRGNFASIMSVFPAGLFNEIGGFDTHFERAEDWDFWLRASFAGWTFIHQSSPLAVINRSHLSLTSDVNKVSQSESQVLSKAVQTQRLSVRQSRRINKRLASGEPSELRLRSMLAMESGDYRSAARLHWRATWMATHSPGPIAKAALFSAMPHLVGTVRKGFGQRRRN